MAGNSAHGNSHGNTHGTARTCQCPCRTEHPATAVTGSRCTGTPQPGMHILKTAFGVGTVAIPVCPFCLSQSSAQESSQRDTETGS